MGQGGFRNWDIESRCIRLRRGIACPRCMQCHPDGRNNLKVEKRPCFRLYNCSVTYHMEFESWVPGLRLNNIKSNCATVVLMIFAKIFKPQPSLNVYCPPRPNHIRLHIRAIQRYKSLTREPKVHQKTWILLQSLRKLAFIECAASIAVLISLLDL